MQALADADLVLVVLDGSAERTKEDEDLLAQTEHRPVIVVENKSDLRIAAPGASGDSAVSPNRSQTWGSRVSTSALTGEGLMALREEILRQVGGDAGMQESGFLTNVRHARLIKESLAALDSAKSAVAGKIPHEMVLMDLYNALRPLDAITGATTTDDILNLIFSTFCIGK